MWRRVLHGAVAYSFFREELRRVWADVRGGDLSPARVAASVAMGAFVGCLPVFGLHLPIVLFLSLRFRLDGAIAYVAANISNPFFAPFLITAEVQLGARLLDGAWLDPATAGSLLDVASASPRHLVAGAPVVGALAGAGLGLGTLGLTLAKRRLLGPGQRPRYTLPGDAPPWVRAVEDVAGRYAPDYERDPTARARFHYVRIKMLLDPVARMVADVAGDAPGVLGHVVDVGAGRGQLSLLLVALGRATRATGVDWDEGKVREGQAAVGEAPVSLSVGDARTAEFPEGDTVLLIDLLHYFTLPEQDALLTRAARAVRAGGRLLVREADPSLGWRSWATWLEERVFTSLRFNRGERVAFRPAREHAAILEREGLVVRVQPAWGRTPFSNVLILGERPPAPPAS